LDDLRANDLAPGTVRRYKSAIKSFIAWYGKEEQRCLTLEQLSPITLIGYRNFLQCTQQRATSTMIGHISALRAGCVWLTVERYLETNPAKRIKLVGRQAASAREGLSPNQVNTLLRQVQSTRDATCNYAIVQVLLQMGMRWMSVVNSHLQILSLVSVVDVLPSDPARAIRLARSRLMPPPRRHLPNTSRLGLAASRQSKPLPQLGHDRHRRSDRLLSGAARRVEPSPRRPCVKCWISLCVEQRLAGWLAPTREHTWRHTFARNYLAENSGDVVGLTSLLGHTSLILPRFMVNRPLNISQCVWSNSVKMPIRVEPF
jgi:site-specific recombinase XerD